MITLIEARNFRLLRYIRQPLENFHVLVGPNASGKTTFLDVISFLGDIVSTDIDTAISKRSPVYEDLTFGGEGGDIELAVEARIPDHIRALIWDDQADTIRYEIRLGLTTDTHEHAIHEERVVIFNSRVNEPEPVIQYEFFPQSSQDTETVLNRKYRLTSYRQIVRKSQKTGNDSFGAETYEAKEGKGKHSGKGWMPSFRLGIKQSAVKGMPADERRSPATFWLRDLLVRQVQVFVLDSLNIRNPSPPGRRGPTFRPDGSNLPWVIASLRKENERRFQHWLDHLRTALPDIEDIRVVERPEDRHSYLTIRYNNGVTVPSWLVSDGTLRLLALTLPAYLTGFTGIYLIEEPENGIHPAAMETVYQSLSSVYGAQMLLATHSTVILGLVKPRQVLCFAKTVDGITDIVRGDEHPALRDWHGEVDFSTLYASGVLG